MRNEIKNVALFTSQDIGFQIVEYLATRDDINLLVVTNRTKRDEIYGYRSALDACRSNDIACVLAPVVNDEVCSLVLQHKPDLIISAYYPAIIPAVLLSLPQLGAINIHPGILPKYRGKYPTPWYILNGETHCGIAVHIVDKKIDAGDILVQKVFPIRENDTGFSLYERTMEEGAALLAQNFDALINGGLPRTPQAGIGSYYRTIEKRFHIDWNLSRTDIARRVRVHARPYFPAYAFLFNRMISINSVSNIELSDYCAQGGGEIVKVWSQGQFAVSCCDGCLRIDDYLVSPPFEPGQRELHIRAGNRLE